MKKLLLAILLIFSLSVIGTRFYKSVVLKQNCTGYLKRSADANTTDTAKNELSKAISYLEANKLTEGYTSVFYNTPDEDIAFWYKNLKASEIELSKVTDKTTSLEKTNLLMKLRETLLDSEKSGDSITVPNGLSVFPDNKLWMTLLSLAVISLIGVFVLIAIILEDY